MGLFLHNNKDFTFFGTVYKFVSVFPRRLSGVEKGFSANKELLVEKLCKVPLTSHFSHLLSKSATMLFLLI